MNEQLACFFYNNYPNIKNIRSFKDCVGMIDLFKDTLIYKIKDKKVIFLAIYLKISNEYFNLIQDNPELFKDIEFIKKCIENKGENIHFAFALGSGTRNILSCLKEIIKKESPLTVSWYKPEMKKIHIIKMRGKLCHQ